MRRTLLDIAQIAAAVTVTVVASAGLMTSPVAGERVSSLVAIPEAISGPPTPSPTAKPSPTPTPTPTEHPAPETPAPTPVPVEPAPTDPSIGGAADPAEQKHIAVTMTNGTLYKSGGAYGARRSAELGDTRVEIEVYPLGAGPDVPIQNLVRFWSHGVLRDASMDYGDGHVDEKPTSRIDCSAKEKQPRPTHVSWLDHTYEPGRYELTATITFDPCVGSDPPDDTDIQTLAVSIDLEIPRHRVIGVVY